MDKLVFQLKGVVIVWMVLTLFFITHDAEANPNISIRTIAIVTLYADGKMVRQYEAISQGKIDGNCFTFHIRRGIREPLVRICGTFSVEYIR